MQNKKPSITSALVLIALMYISIVAIGLNTANKGITGAVSWIES